MPDSPRRILANLRKRELECQLQLGSRVRTASGSDGIIFHFSFSIYHWPFGGFISHRTTSNNEQMKNAKWKMTNDPVATARGSDTPNPAKAGTLNLLFLLPRSL